jgi:hypothetical protein
MTPSPFARFAASLIHGAASLVALALFGGLVLLLPVILNG